MRRIALLIPFLFLFACASAKPAAQTTPVEEETTEEAPEEEVPESTGELDPACYNACMDDTGGDDVQCEADCGGGGGDGSTGEDEGMEMCMDDCMSSEGSDEDECAGYCGVQ